MAKHPTSTPSKPILPAKSKVMTCSLSEVYRLGFDSLAALAAKISHYKICSSTFDRRIEQEVLVDPSRRMVGKKFLIRSRSHPASEGNSDHPTTTSALTRGSGPSFCTTKHGLGSGLWRRLDAGRGN